MSPKKKQAPARKPPAKQSTTRKVTRKANTAAPLTCPDCGFQAKHAMGLGRHRSSRHGALSLRAKREAKAAKTTPKQAPTKTPAAFPNWITRRQAAALAGIHYNTVQLWERAGRFTTKKRGREVLINEAQFRATLPASTTTKAVPKKGSAAASATDHSQLLQRLNDLADGLEQLARVVRPRKRRGRPPRT